MARYAQALLRGGELDGDVVLSSAALEEMFTTRFTPDRRVGGIGLAFFSREVDGHRFVGHDGNLPGFASALLLAPDDDLGVVVLTNTATHFDAHVIADAIARDTLRPAPTRT